MSLFSHIVCSWPRHQRLDLPGCRKAFQALITDVNLKVKGQRHFAARVTQAFLMNTHVLVQGLPGGGKTRGVSVCAKATGVKVKRVQFRQDLLSPDLLGGRVLKLDANGTAYFDHFDGPIYATIVIADEINRAPAKIQAATLEAMSERLISRTDKGVTETIYDRANRDELAAYKSQADRTCFQMEIPDPDDSDRATFVVFATQNPIDMEGTYPLSEAQLDRFTFMLLMNPPKLNAFTEILLENLKPSKTHNAQSPDVPLWIRTIMMLDWLRGQLFSHENGPVMKLLDQGRDAKQRGLWDRIRLILLLSHYRHGETGLGMAGGDPMSLDVRNPYQRYLQSFISGWLAEGDTPLKCSLRKLLENPIFESVLFGASARALQDWPKAAAVLAFQTSEGADVVIRRSHFRQSADDILRHRIHLTAQARANGVEATDIIHLLVDTILPRIDPAQEENEDKLPLLPDDQPDPFEIEEEGC